MTLASPILIAGINIVGTPLPIGLRGTLQATCRSFALLIELCFEALLAITAPLEVTIDRLEVHERRMTDRLEKEGTDRLNEPHERELDWCPTS